MIWEGIITFNTFLSHMNHLACFKYKEYNNNNKYKLILNIKNEISV